MRRSSFAMAFGCLFMTGYSRDAIIRHGRLDPGVHVIGKPFSFHELAAKVRDRLDAPG